MPRDILDVPLRQSAPGTRRTVRMVRYGTADARPKAYIHAALHADETPGILVAHHLMRLLDAAEAREEIAGQVVLVPYANPIGLAQYVNGDQFGRHDLNSGANFNRGWPDLFAPVAERVDGHLGGGAEANVDIIRKAMREVLDSRTPAREVDSLRLALSREACDADFVLDLHCDDEGLMHLFLVPSLWPAAADLAGELGCRAVMLADDTGGATFAESFAQPWSRLALSFPGYAIPQACFSATVELRGFADVSDELAEKDALALFRELQRRGHVAGEPGPAPSAPCEATDFDACDVVRAPFAGVVSYRVELGQHVQRGEAIADLLDPAAGEASAARRTIHADTDGLVLSRRLRKLVTAGEVIAKIVGKEPLTHRQGYLLED